MTRVDFRGGNYVGDLGFEVSFRHTVAVDRETVTVPAGTFKDCVRVDTSSTEGANSGYGPGEELVFTLDGMLSFEVEGEEYMLRRGDALHFRTDRPHRWRNSGRRPARALWMALRSP